MNICLISDDYQPALTGVGFHVQCIAGELQKRGHNVTVITTRRKGEAAVEENSGVKIYRFNSIKFSGFALGITTPRKIKKIFLEQKIEIVHLHYFGLLMLAGIRAAKKLGLKLMLTDHVRPYQLSCHFKEKFHWLPMLSGIYQQGITKFIKYTCNACDLVAVPSSGMLQEAKAYGVTKPLRVTFLPIKKPGPINSPMENSLHE